MELGNKEVPSYMRRWEEELDCRVTDPEAWQILKIMSATSVNCKILELNFKCLVRMYMTPDREHKCQKEISQFCWRGCKEIGSTAHIWWLCPEIRKFWGEVREIIKGITNRDIQDNPWECLFHKS